MLRLHNFIMIATESRGRRVVKKEQHRRSWATGGKPQGISRYIQTRITIATPS